MRPRHSPPTALTRAAWLIALGLTLAPEAEAAPASPTSTPRPDATLEPDGGGRLRHRGDGFTAIIHPDGSVDFHDHGGSAEGQFLGLDLRRRRLLDPVPERHDPAWTDVIERVLFPAIGRFPGGRAPLLTSLGARFGGLADGPRKSRHMGAKRAFLAATEALRLRLANDWYRARLHSELAELGAQLTAVWRDSKLPLAERKRRIFERWVECEDPATVRSELDTARLAVARTARAKIEAFIRQNAPRSSPLAYTEAELARFNRARAGKSRFRPYDAPAPSPDTFADSDPPAPTSSITTPLSPEQSPQAAPPPAPPFGPDPEPGRLRPTPERSI